MTSPTVHDLRQVELFDSLTHDDLSEVADWFEAKQVAVGDTLTREGASGYAFVILGTATVKVTQAGAVIAELGPGDFLGEAAILGEGRRNATITVTEAGTVWVLFGTRFRELGMRFPQVHAELERVLRARQG